MTEYQTHCVQCGKLYSARRKTSKFCGDKCRQNYHRNHGEGVNVDNELYKALDALRLLDAVNADDLSKRVWYIERINAEMEKINAKLEERVRLIFGKTAKDEAYSIIAKVLDSAMQQIGFDYEPEAIQEELRSFRDKNW